MDVEKPGWVDWVCFIQINKKAGLVHTAKQGGRFSLSLEEQSLQGSSLQVINSQREKVTVDTYTHPSAFALRPQEGFVISERLPWNWGIGIMSAVHPNSGLHLLQASSALHTQAFPGQGDGCGSSLLICPIWLLVHVTRGFAEVCDPWERWRRSTSSLYPYFGLACTRNSGSGLSLTCWHLT